MKRSDTLVALTPPGVVTVTCTLSTPAGDVAWTSVSLTTLTAVAAAEPKRTSLVPQKPEPVIVMGVPPARVPEAGEMPLTAGRGGSTTVTPAVARACGPPLRLID